MRSKKAPVVDARFWGISGQTSQEFAEVTYSDFQFEPHFHDHYVWMLVEKGVNLGQRQKSKYEVLPGEMFFLNPGETHTGYSQEGKTLRYLAMYPSEQQLNDWLEKMDQSSAGLPEFSPKCQNPVLGNQMKRLAMAVSNPVSDQLQVEVCLFEFLESILAATAGRPRQLSNKVLDPQRFIVAKKFISEQYADQFTLEMLAAACHTSPFHLIKLFKKHAGMTPFSYLRSIRVEKAKQLIKRNISLTEVAYQSGFYDQSHFIRCFKSHTGVLPSTYKAGLIFR